MWEQLVERLQRGETVTFRPRGHSMAPRIQSGQEVVVEPIFPSSENFPSRGLFTGDVVLCKVKGRYFLHKITQIDLGRYPARFLISNNKGHDNGWTTHVFGKARV